MRIFGAFLLLSWSLLTWTKPAQNEYWDANSVKPILWSLDNLDYVGGDAITVLGTPKVVETPRGKAVEFDGVEDGLLVSSHPLEGQRQFTIEVIFRPDPDGLKEQRFLHLQEGDSENRILLETRLTTDGKWFLDTYIRSNQTDQTLYAEHFPHPLGQWHVAALVFDGKEMRHYVNGQIELAKDIVFSPPHRGRTSIGVRLNKVHWFKGAIRKIRFTARALSPEEFLSAEL
jgi:Concanavalin A-like lectin/glucanases superfamily